MDELSGGRSISSGTVVVGYQSTGANALTISNGATLTSAGPAAAGENGGTGTIIVTGTGSKLNLLSNLYLANVGASTGTVNVTNNGILSATNGETIVGNGSGAVGTLNVSNGGQYNGNGVVVGQNSGGTGVLNVMSGGIVTTSGNIDIGITGATGTATVSGTGSVINAQTYVAVGYDTLNSAAAEGTLNVTNGAVLNTPILNVGLGKNGSGTLNIGTGGTAGTINGAIIMGGASSIINVNQNSTYTFANIISNVVQGPPTTGAVNFIGSGDTILTGASTYTVATNVTAGTLTVAAGGSIAGSLLTTIGNGGTLAGAGTLGAVTVQSGGTVAPTGTGTLTTGAITFASGSALQATLTSSGLGNIAATTATLNGGTVQILPSPASLINTTSFGSAAYTLINTTGGVTGKFAGLSAPTFVYYNLALDYSHPDAVNLDITRNNVTVVSTAGTPNETAVANAISTGAPAGLTTAIEGQTALSGARQAFNSLSGEVYATTKNALVQNAQILAGAINNRLTYGIGGGFADTGTLASTPGLPNNVLGYAATAKPSGAWQAVRPAEPPPVVYATWAQGFGDWLHEPANGNASSTNVSTGGVIAGLDATYLGTSRVGVAGGYSNSSVSASALGSSAHASSYYISTYGATRLGRFGFQLGGAYTGSSISSTRNVAFPGFAETESGHHSADTGQVFGEINTRLVLQSNFVAEPFAGLSYINLHSNSFTEQGGVAALTVASTGYDVGLSTLGARGTSIIQLQDGMAFVGAGTIGWRHAIGNINPLSVAAFATGPSFSVAGEPIARGALLAEAGWNLNVNANYTVGVNWTGQFGGNISENTLRGQMTYRW